MRRRGPARLSVRRLLVLLTITLSSLPLVMAVGSVIATPKLGDAQFIVEVLIPAALTFAAGNAMALILVRRRDRRPSRASRRLRSDRMRPLSA